MIVVFIIIIRSLGVFRGFSVLWMIVDNYCDLLSLVESGLWRNRRDIIDPHLEDRSVPLETTAPSYDVLIERRILRVCSPEQREDDGCNACNIVVLEHVTNVSRVG